MPVFYTCGTGLNKWNNNDYIPHGVEVDFEPYGGTTSVNETYIQSMLASQGITWQGYVDCFNDYTGPMDGTWRVYSRKQATANGDVKYLGACLMPGECPQEYYITRTWTATDDCGNSANAIQTLYVVDNTAPEISLSPASPLDCNPTPAQIAAAFGTATVTDNCSDNLTATGTIGAETGSGCTYSTTKSWTSTDDCGNVGTASQTVTYTRDTYPPTIICPPDITAYAEEGGTATVTISYPSATDNCTPTASITFSGVRSDYLPLDDAYPTGTTTITWTAADLCDNLSSCTQTITVGSGCVNVEAWVYLEGSCADPGGTASWTVPMRTTLNDLQILPGQTCVDLFLGSYWTPPGQPYNIAPWNYSGTEGAAYNSFGVLANGKAGYPSTVTDWVLVSLRSTPDLSGGTLCQAAALLHKDGHIQFMEGFGCCDFDMNGSYYVVIEHRDHLIVMSHVPVPVVNGTITYDFRNKQSYIYDPFGLGTWVGQKQILPGVYAMYAANGQQASTTNADTDITSDDRTYWELQNGTISRYRNGDYNMNGDCNSNDRILWEFNNGRFTSVPR
jgi:hypothetical protein